MLSAHRAASAPPTDRYVVATGQVAAGQVVRAADLGTIAIDLPRGVDAVPADAAESLVGRVARTSLGDLALIRATDLHEPGRFVEGAEVEVGIELSAATALVGSLEVGDRVDVLATGREDAGTRTVATGARVTSLASSQETAIGVDGALRVRLGVPDTETAARVVDASIRSEVSLILPAPGDGSAG